MLPFLEARGFIRSSQTRRYSVGGYDRRLDVLRRKPLVVHSEEGPLVVNAWPGWVVWFGSTAASTFWTKSSRVPL
ncbi:MAG: hypothetical protein CME19_04995 [Gemmatimonadetes bacterium]|nr:hypothetical protein [Gemmatimonadota bacterium]